MTMVDYLRTTMMADPTPAVVDVLILLDGVRTLCRDKHVGGQFSDPISGMDTVLYAVSRARDTSLSLAERREDAACAAARLISICELLDAQEGGAS